MMKLDYRLVLYAALTIVTWGFWGLFGKLALERKMEPITVFLAEILISAIVAVPIAVVQYSRAAQVQWNYYGLISGAALAAGLVFYYLALRRSPASIVVPLTASYPLVSVALSRVFLHEQLRLPQVIGAVLVVVGIILLLMGPETA
jgi:bacterial/archaeal transporter family protein